MDMPKTSQLAAAVLRSGVWMGFSTWESDPANNAANGGFKENIVN
jgi:hypothetical protein